MVLSWSQVLGSGSSLTNSTVGSPTSTNFTVIEFIGSDRPGLLTDMCTALLELNCNVVNASVWTHNTRAASILLLTDVESGKAVTDSTRLYSIKETLCNVLTGNSSNVIGANIAFTDNVIHTEHRMHQMMLADLDYERGSSVDLDKLRRPKVNVANWYDKDCSVLTIEQCTDRPRLLFDTICTLTDMGYVVLHGDAKAESTEAFQEYCIRHVYGSVVKSDTERQRLIHCIQAAIERRVSKGLKIEVCTAYRIGLLSDVTRIFNENNLTVTRAEVGTQGDKVVSTFYLLDASGYPVDSNIIHSVREEIERTVFGVNHNPQDLNQTPQESPSSYLKVQT